MPALQILPETIRFREPFRIAGHVFDIAEIVTVTLDDGRHIGRGEASGVFFLGDDIANMLDQLERARADIERGIGREELRDLLPPGGARSAVDGALWELEARQTATPVWQLAGLAQAPRPIRTTFTLGAEEPDAMAAAASGRLTGAKSIKVKLTGDLVLDTARIHAIRAARPDVWLGVDANQGYVRADLPDLIDAMVTANVSLIEQPLARGHDAELEGLASPIPIAGDESLVSLADLAHAPGRFDVVNIKLDKCGGLTEGLMMVAEARRLGLAVMVGTMIGTSLATAPGFVLGQLCDLVDLDGPTFLAADRMPGVSYQDGNLYAGPDVWGLPE